MGITNPSFLTDITQFVDSLVHAVRLPFMRTHHFRQTLSGVHVLDIGQIGR